MDRSCVQPRLGSSEGAEPAYRFPTRGEAGVGAMSGDLNLERLLGQVGSAITKGSDFDPAHADLFGGSEEGAICGVSPWRGPRDVYNARVFKVPTVVGEAAEWGQILEAVVAAYFAHRHHVKIAKPPVLLQPHGREWQRCSADFLLEAGDGLEIKTTSERVAAKALGVPGTDDIPVDHYMQAQTYLEAYRARRWHVAYLVGGQRYVEYLVSPDRRVQDLILRKSEELWGRIQAKDPPPGGCLAPLYLPRAPPRQATPEEMDWAVRYIKAMEEVKEREEAAKELRDRLEESLGSVEEAEGEDVRIVSRVVRPQKPGTDWEKVARAIAHQAGISAGALAEITQQYAKPPRSPYRMAPVLKENR